MRCSAATEPHLIRWCLADLVDLLTANCWDIFDRLKLRPSGSPAEEAMRRRMLARQAYAAAQADRQLRLAKLRRTRSYREWACGELVCYWREGGGRSKRDRVKVSKGCYCGPAVVISQVHRRVGDQAVPRNVVLLLHRGELILATPSQLRSASETEKAMFQIDGVAGNLTPDFLEK